jgi:hypothetical protein
MEWSNILSPRGMDRVVILPKGDPSSSLTPGHCNRFDFVVIVVRYRSINIRSSLREVRPFPTTGKITHRIPCSNAHWCPRRIRLLGFIIPKL